MCSCHDAKAISKCTYKYIIVAKLATVYCMHAYVTWNVQMHDNTSIATRMFVNGTVQSESNYKGYTSIIIII